jgi:hypothetical protein
MVCPYSGIGHIRNFSKLMLISPLQTCKPTAQKGA